MFSISGGRGLQIGAAPTSFRTCLALCIAAFLLGACAPSTRVDFGGVMNEQSVPAETLSCSDVEWRKVERKPPDYPRELISFRILRQDRNALDSLVFSYDVDETGSPANIRFVEPESYLGHATMRKAILASAQAIEQWRFHAEGKPGYVVGCSTKMEFAFTTT